MFAVIDTETTGLDVHDQVVEIGAVLVSAIGGRETWSTFVRPTVPVHPAARAAHHILDEDLVHAPTVADLLGRLELDPLRWIRGAIVVAHNLKFDVRMLEQSGLAALLPARRICTWRCARHVWPQAPSHGNQALRYWLGFDAPSALERAPHRAVSDALVTAGLLEMLLKEREVEELVRLSGAPVLLEKVTVGQYRGRPWSEMDAGYLTWVLDPRRTFDEDVRHTARHWLEQKRSAARAKQG